MDPQKKLISNLEMIFCWGSWFRWFPWGISQSQWTPHNGPCVFRIACFIGRQKNVALKTPWVGDSDSNPCDSIHLLFQPPVFFNSWWLSFSNQDLLLSFIPTPKKVDCHLTTSYCHWFLAFWCPCRGDKHTMTALWLSNQRHFQETPAAPPRL